MSAQARTIALQSLIEADAIDAPVDALERAAAAFAALDPEDAGRVGLLLSDTTIPDHRAARRSIWRLADAARRAQGRNAQELIERGQLLLNDSSPALRKSIESHITTGQLLLQLARNAIDDDDFGSQITSALFAHELVYAPTEVDGPELREE